MSKNNSNSEVELDYPQHCDHEHAVFPDSYISEHGGSGYCEDCGAEITEAKKLAY